MENMVSIIEGYLISVPDAKRKACFMFTTNCLFVFAFSARGNLIDCFC